ncbi:hypothetical protein [Bradyrhizobium sp. 2TAF24]|uniref:hypothetical protein n=1 Tax=Bradyrhizobium sp. 2TAF24 TaxID=3233011 RepID=UPI003F9236A8
MHRLKTSLHHLDVFSLVVCSLAVIASTAQAQPAGTLSVRFAFEGRVDCDQPRHVRDFPIHGEGTASLQQNRRTSLDMSIRATSTNRLHFDTNLGGAPTTAPGGTMQLRVISASRLRAIWQLPNNSFNVDLTAQGSSCAIRIDTALNRGSRQYTLFDGGQFYFCSKPRILSTRCSAQ